MSNKEECKLLEEELLSNQDAWKFFWIGLLFPQYRKERNVFKSLIDNCNIINVLNAEEKDLNNLRELIKIFKIQYAGKYPYTDELTNTLKAMNIDIDKLLNENNTQTSD